MTDLIERFKEFAEGLQLSDYELFFCAAVLVSYPKTANKSYFKIDTDNTVYLEVKMQDCEHELEVGKNYISYHNSKFDFFESGVDGQTEYSVIEKFFKEIQNG